MKRATFLVGATLMLGTGAALAVARAPAVADAGPSTTGDAAHGKQVFVATGCYQCHGYVG